VTPSSSPKEKEKSDSKHIEKPSSSQKDRVLGQIDEKIVVKVENDSNKKKEEVHSTRVVERREERSNDRTSEKVHERGESRERRDRDRQKEKERREEKERRRNKSSTYLYGLSLSYSSSGVT
jgi:hypothetical protein